MRSASINQLRRLLSSLSPSLGQLLQINIRAPRKIGATHPTPQNCRQMIPLRSRSDSWTFTPEPHAIRIESNFSRCPLIKVVFPFLVKCTRQMNYVENISCSRKQEQSYEDCC